MEGSKRIDNETIVMTIKRQFPETGSGAKAEFGEMFLVGFECRLQPTTCDLTTKST
jgi:hypothetical protein